MQEAATSGLKPDPTSELTTAPARHPKEVSRTAENKENSELL